MKAIQNIEDFNRLLTQGGPLLLDFYADWCGPCQTLLPTVEKLASEYDGNVEIRKINVDENRDLAAHFGVKSIPALFFVKRKTIVDRVSGTIPEFQIRKRLDALVEA